MQKQIIITLFLFLLSSAYADQSVKVPAKKVRKTRAQLRKEKRDKYWETTSKSYRKYVGVTGDISLAPGISMKRWGERNGVMLNILPFYYEENYDTTGDYEDYEYRYNGYDKSGFLLAGGAFMRKLNQGRMHRLYHYIGGHYYSYYTNADYYEDSYNYLDDMDDLDHIETYEWTHEAGIGTGVGVEIWSRRIAIDVRAGIVGAYEFTQESKKILPSIGFGVYYRYDKRK